MHFSVAQCFRAMSLLTPCRETQYQCHCVCSFLYHFLTNYTPSFSFAVFSTPLRPFQHLMLFRILPPPAAYSPTTNPFSPFHKSPRQTFSSPIKQIKFSWREAVLVRNYLLVPWFLFPLFCHLKLLLYKNLILVWTWRQFALAINSSC